MTDYAKMIPPEVEEAAARALAAVRMPNYTWDDLDHEMQAYLKDDARAAIATMLAAWPGVAPHGYYTANGPRDGLILPLPAQEPGK